jgi:DNA-binding transcriptional ArsR family regulator
LLLTDYPVDDVLVVRDHEQLRALGGDLRARIVMLLRERAASTTELAEALGVAKGTAGHHVKVLEQAGLIRVVATRRVRAVTESYYGRVARLFVLKTDESEEGLVGEGALAAVFLRQAAEEILPADIQAARITAGLTHARLRPADARRFGLRVNRLFAAIQAADHPDGEPHGFAGALYPAPSALPRRGKGA